MIREHPGEAAAALHLAASWEAPRAAAAFASSGWMPLEEEDDRRRLTGIRLLARLDGRNGTYEERRSRISGGVLPRALSHAAPGEVERVLANLLEATSDMVAFSAGDRSVPAGPSLDRTGAITEKDLQSFVKLEALSPIAAKRLAEHHKAVERLVKQMVEYARSDSGRSEPDAFALSLVPVASSVAPELGNDLAEAIFARDLSRRRIDKARGRSGRLQDAVAYLILEDTERSRRLLDDFIAASPDDGAFLSLVKAAAQSDAHDRLTAAARRGTASSSTADQMRGALIAALVGDLIKEGSRVAAKRLAAPIASRRQEVIELLEEWRGAAGDAKLAVERRLFQSSPPLPPHIAISDDHAAAQLLGDRLQEWADERQASSRDRLFGAKAPPAWPAHLNIRPFGA